MSKSSFYTRNGDDGYTGLLGEGRVAKYDPRPAAYGALDEASSALIAGYGNPGRLLSVGQEPSVWALQADSMHRMGIDWRTVRYRGLKTNRYTYVVDRGRHGTDLKRYLYDNLEDPYQLNPVTAVHAGDNDIMTKLDKELQDWLIKMHDPFSLD